MYQQPDWESDKLILAHPCFIIIRLRQSGNFIKAGAENVFTVFPRTIFYVVTIENLIYFPQYDNFFYPQNRFFKRKLLNSRNAVVTASEETKHFDRAT